MKQKSVLILLFLALGSIFASAADFSSVVFNGISGQTWSFDAEKLQIKPQGEQLIITTQDGTQTILELKNLASFGLSASSESSVLGIQCADGPFSVYSSMGTKLGSFNSIPEIESQLGVGLYICVSKSGSFKIKVK